MGLFGSGLGAVLGGAAGFILGGPGGAMIGAGLGGSLGGMVDQNSAAKKQTNEINSLMSWQQQQADYQIRLLEQSLKEAAPLQTAQRAAALKMVPILEQEALAAPGSSSFFKETLKRATQNYLEALAPYGLDSSGRAKYIGVPQLTTDLTLADWQNKNVLRSSLASMNPNNLNLVPSFLSGRESALNNVAQLNLAKSGLQYQNNLNNINTIASLPLSTFMMYSAGKNMGLFGNSGGSVGTNFLGYQAPSYQNINNNQLSPYMSSIYNSPSLLSMGGM